MMQRQIMNLQGRNTADGGFDWTEAAADSLIIAGVTFFSTLSGTTLAGVPSGSALIGAAIAAATQFFITLAIKRGLRKPEPE